MLRGAAAESRRVQFGTLVPGVYATRHIGHFASSPTLRTRVTGSWSMQAEQKEWPQAGSMQASRKLSRHTGHDEAAMLAAVRRAARVLLDFAWRVAGRAGTLLFTFARLP